MEIIANPSDWTAPDAENLVKFLETETGKRLIPKLVESEPALLDGGDVNRILIRSGEVRAFKAMIEALFNLAHPPPPPPQPITEYPPLTKDEAWNDGQKLTPEPTSPPVE